MSPQQPNFFPASFQIESGTFLLSLHGLANLTGITKIILASDLPVFWKNMVGQPVVVLFDKLPIEGVLLSQQIEYGIFYEIKFRGLSEPARKYIEKQIKENGISPSWQRKYPRISIKGIQDPDLPVPNLCLVRFVGKEIFVNVVNFTLGGIRIETFSDNLEEVTIGSVLHFDLITSSGEIFSNLLAKICNIATHNNLSENGISLTRSFGLSLAKMNPENEQKYRKLILDYCTILKKKMLGN